jgi:hypothetical protein
VKVIKGNMRYIYCDFDEESLGANLLETNLVKQSRHTVPVLWGFLEFF